METPEKTKEEKRRELFTRLMLDNFGGLLAVAAVIWQGGSVMEKVNAIATTQAAQGVQLTTQGEQLTAVRLDVIEVKARVGNHEKEIEQLQRAEARRGK